MTRTSVEGRHRREFLAGASQLAIGSLLATEVALPACGAEEPSPATHQATGVRVGDVTDTSAVVWTRLTQHSARNSHGVTFPKKNVANEPPAATNGPVDQFEGACPGISGRVRLRYGRQVDLSDATTTDWAECIAAGDFIHPFRLAGLSPGSVYHYESQTAGPGGAPLHGVLRGKFSTSPRADAPSELTFCVMTCQGYPDRGHVDGHDIYPAMQALQPKFACLTGDLVYYDNDAPKAVTARLARYHWERMFSLPRLLEFTRNVGSYWLKDDHDTLNNDSWPGAKMGELTFVEGQKIFREQAPLSGGPAYRTFRWGRDLQLWFTDGRDFRSPNKTPDGPDKSIWGREQKAWFQRTVQESTARWKVLVSPTPLVGPDRQGKNDNHANAGFRHEGDELRAWLQAHVPENFFIICGDRHWQYHSVHPQTGVQEFSAGAASNEHAGGTPGVDKAYHKFHRAKGGFLSVTVQPTAAGSSIHFRHHDVYGNVVYEYEK